MLLTLAFASAPDLKSLTLPRIITRRTVLQKVRRRTNVLRQLVNTGFQVLFHSPPGVLFTFPSQYYALSVTEYDHPLPVLPAIEDGVVRIRLAEQKLHAGNAQHDILQGRGESID